jgi:hypothetical protein
MQCGRVRHSYRPARGFGKCQQRPRCPRSLRRASHPRPPGCGRKVELAVHRGDFPVDRALRPSRCDDRGHHGRPGERSRRTEGPGPRTA